MMYRTTLLTGLVCLVLSCAATMPATCGEVAELHVTAETTQSHESSSPEIDGESVLPSVPRTELIEIAPNVYWTSSIWTASVPSEVIIDDGQAFLGGTPRYWQWASGYGIGGSMRWCYVNGNAIDNYAAWNSRLPAGRYEIIVFVCRNHPVRDSGTVIAQVPVNQNAFFDQWVSLGTYDFRGEPSVLLADDTGESYISTKRQIGFDAVKFVSRNPVPPSISPEIRAFLDRAHAQLGWKTEPPYYCLKVVWNWSGFPLGGHANANALEQHFRRKGVFRTGKACDAPLGSWLFFNWWNSRGQNLGHVGFRCEHGMIHQDNSLPGVKRGTVNHCSNPDAYMKCTGYVTFEDARYWYARR